ncbi:hypothetical protein [Metasolibacillus meyeri]|uniref:hypothetical protein n=1 Tax=Metasolibacillus meyeri TaxID=1071052 RepID=UPI00187D6259|nr:hypothetical protein [Metasolibacillus meyeri]
MKPTFESAFHSRLKAIIDEEALLDDEKNKGFEEGVEEARKTVMKKSLIIQI